MTTQATQQANGLQAPGAAPTETLSPATRALVPALLDFLSQDGCSDEQYLQALEWALEDMERRFDPGLVIYLAGRKWLPVSRPVAKVARTESARLTADEPAVPAERALGENAHHPALLQDPDHPPDGPGVGAR